MSSSFKNDYLPSQEELDEAMARGRKLRAEAFRHGIAEIAHGVSGLFRRLRSPAPTRTVAAN